MVNLYRLPMDVEYDELSHCAEVASQVIFANWHTDDFAALFASLKHYPTLQKYIEFEKENLRPWLFSHLALPTKERRLQEKTLSERSRLELAYAHWRMATISLLLQNKLLALKTVRTSTAQKTVDTSIDFLLDLERFYEFSPVWILQFGETSPFLNEVGEEIWYPDD